jgi:hypothetical protein
MFVIALPVLSGRFLEIIDYPPQLFAAVIKETLETVARGLPTNK